MAGQQWTLASEGGYLANPKLSSKLRYHNTAKYVFRQFSRSEPGFGKQSGETIDFDKISMAQTQGGQIGEFQDIPETKFVITKDSLQVTEWGNSIPWTGKLETLSEFNPSQPVQKAILNDQKKVLDEAVATALKTTDVIYEPTSSSTQAWNVDGVAGAAGVGQFNFFHLKEMVDAAQTGLFGAGNQGNIIPTMPDGNFALVLSVKACRGLFDDPEYQEFAKFSYPRKLFNGEIDEITYNCRIIKNNNRGSLSETTGAIDLGEAILLGDDSIIEGVALREELRYKLAVKYGRDKGLAWYAVLGFKVPWDYSADGETHAIFFSCGS
jgi:hypothetical protein